MSKIQSLTRWSLFLLAGGAVSVACARRTSTSGDQPAEGAVRPHARPRVAFRVPGEDSIPAGREGEAVRLGRDLALHTFERLPDQVGSDLHCSSCHTNAGTTPGAGPWIGLSSAYPEYRSRVGREITLEERINECFERSMNGKALAHDSKEMTAFLAYIDWLSAGVPKGAEVAGRGYPRLERPPNIDPAAGEKEYAARCATCHGMSGEGKRHPDGSYFAPPLWGPRAFNIAAGMARLDTAGAFVKHNMPLGQPNTITAWESYDIASYFTTQPRADFEGKRGDWPKGGKPADARY